MLVWSAAALGILHAGFSLYWAVGGRWLLSTVGSWAVDSAAAGPVRTGIALGAVTLVKLLAALVPIGAEYGWIPGRRSWRLVSLAGGVGLVLYGGVNIVASGAVLAGWIVSPGGYDRDAMIGHTFLWDPLFAAWGACLVISVLLTSPQRRRTRRG